MSHVNTSFARTVRLDAASRSGSGCSDAQSFGGFAHLGVRGGHDSAAATDHRPLDPASRATSTPQIVSGELAFRHYRHAALRRAGRRPLTIRRIGPLSAFSGRPAGGGERALVLQRGLLLEDQLRVLGVAKTDLQPTFGYAVKATVLARRGDDRVDPLKQVRFIFLHADITRRIC